MIRPPIITSPHYKQLVISARKHVDSKLAEQHRTQWTAADTELFRKYLDQGFRSIPPEGNA